MSTHSRTHETRSPKEVKIDADILHFLDAQKVLVLHVLARPSDLIFVDKNGGEIRLSHAAS